MERNEGRVNGVEKRNSERERGGRKKKMNKINKEPLQSNNTSQNKIKSLAQINMAVSTQLVWCPGQNH